MLGVKRKLAGDTLDYDIDFEDWIPDGDSILSATAIADDGLTVADCENLSPIVKVWLAGGTTGSTYKVTVTVTTVGIGGQSRVKEVSFNLRVAEC